MRSLGSKIKDPVLLVAVLSWVGVLGWMGFVLFGTTRELSALTPQLEQSRAENKRFKAFLTEKRHQETIRDSLVAQIGVIRGVDGDRYVWPHVLDAVTTSTRMEPSNSGAPLCDFVEHVRPHVAVAVHAADDADLRHQRIADGFLMPLLGEERLEPLVLGAALLQLRRERAQLAGGAEQDEAHPAQHAHPAQDGHEENGILDLAAQTTHALQRPQEGPPSALALEVGAEIDGDHRSSILVGVTRRCEARGRSGASEAGRPRPPGAGRRHRPPPAASRSGWPAGPGCAAGRTALC